MRRDLSLDDHLGVRRDEKILSPGLRRREPEGLLEKRRGGRVIVVSVRRHAAAGEKKRRMMAQYDDHGGPFVFLLVLRGHRLEMMMGMGREAHPPRLVVHVLGKGDVVKAVVDALHDAGHREIRAGVILLVHAYREHSQIGLRAFEHNLLAGRLGLGDGLGLSFLELAPGHLKAQLHIRFQLAHAQPVGAKLAGYPGVVEKRKCGRLAIQRRNVLEQDHFLLASLIQML